MELPDQPHDDAKGAHGTAMEEVEQSERMESEVAVARNEGAEGRNQDGREDKERQARRGAGWVAPLQDQQLHHG